MTPSDRNICDAKSVKVVHLCLLADSRDAVDEILASAEKGWWNLMYAWNRILRGCTAAALRILTGMSGKWDESLK